MTDSGLSVVVIGRNEGDRLDSCLRSVFAMERPSSFFEVIYVDSDSTDGSAELAERLGAIVLRVHPERPTAALGRNAGWKYAHGAYVLFLDGDTLVDPRFAVDALNEFKDNTIAIVWGHRREIRPQDSIYNRALDLDWIYRPGITDFCGGDALVKRSILDEVNGFDEHLIAGEEPEMCRRIRARGYKILHIDHPMTGHDLAMKSWSQYWKRATRAGYAYAEVSDRFRSSGLPFWEEEVRRNRIRAGFLYCVAFAGILLSIVLRNAWPLVCCCAVLVGLVLRTAWKAQWKSENPKTLILYGIHSHLQQIPILWGQMQYAKDRNKGHKRSLIEYKSE